MSTPTAGPDDRSPTAEEQQALDEFRAWFLESYPKDCVIFDPSWHVASIFRAATHQLVSALRSARRDVATQRATVIREVVDIINDAREEGEVDPRAIRARVEQLASSPPILEKNDRG